MSRDQGKIVEVTTSNIGEELYCTTIPLYYYTMLYTTTLLYNCIQYDLECFLCFATKLFRVQEKYFIIPIELLNL